MRASKILEGNRIFLDRLKKDDLTTLMKWQLKEPIMRSFDALPMKPKSEDEWQKWMDEDSHNQFKFAIRDCEKEKLMGYTVIDGILWNHRTAWISILIGDENSHGKGYGTEAMERAIHFAFCELNLHRLQLTVFSYNTQAIKLYERLGFVREGIYREFLERDMKRHDMYLYGLLRTEWENQQTINQ